MTKPHLKEKSIQITIVISEMFDENAFILHIEGRNDCIVVDPSFDTESIFQYVQEHQLQIAAILNTHGHTDHIVGNQEVKKQFPDAPIVIGAGDAPKLTDPELNLSASYGLGITSPEADLLVNHGDWIEFAGIRLETRNTPGHSCGHVVWIWHDSTPTIAINGDVLFAGSIGRTDFADGSFADLEHSIRTQLYPLHEDTLVLTGHGPSTTIGSEKRTNPFVPARIS